MKQQDYHSILSVILKSYKSCQDKAIQWTFKHENDRRLILRIPCLFIIGDTEGHDKLCGRIMNRQITPYLCRYCDIHRDHIDDPFYKSISTKMSEIKRMVAKNDKEKLNQISMHCVRNAWHDIQFCDTKYGLHGSTLAELLHTMQQGIFEYTVKQLFNSKKTKKSMTNSSQINQKKVNKRKREEEEYIAPDSTELGNHNVFSKSYEDIFENLCKKYGKILQHQSDRNLPRTYFNTRYMTITRKNGHEMAGLILAFLSTL